ncbi:hypothetical protein BVRB_1g011470 [Beta vulgaris subsp. vulgaris]|nr:hypothetical protein BVRB_1g011470 [Beta vulgaris subsp. vulgaris]
MCQCFHKQPSLILLPSTPQICFAVIGCLPDFAEVYSFIGSVFDPDTKGHVRKLKEMDPINFETGLRLKVVDNVKEAEFILAHGTEALGLSSGSVVPKHLAYQIVDLEHPCSEFLNNVVLQSLNLMSYLQVHASGKL